MRHQVSHCLSVNNDQPRSPEVQDATRYSVGELSEAADVSRRAVRFYVQRGLLAAPIGVGRGAYYTAAHLERLVALKQLQEGGMSLDEVGLALEGAERPTAPENAHPAPRLAPEAWLRVVVAPGVELSLRAGLVAPDVLKDMVEALRERLTAQGGGAATTDAAAEKQGGDDDDDRT